MMKTKLPKNQMQKHTHLVHTAKWQTTQHTCAEMAQELLKDKKDTKLTTIKIQETKALNQECLQEMPRPLSSKTL